MPEQGKSFVSRSGTGERPVKPHNERVGSAKKMNWDGRRVLAEEAEGVGR